MSSHRVATDHRPRDVERNPADSGMGSRTVRKYRGSCHCGAVVFEIESDFPELTTCDCSICRRKNALMVKVHESQFGLLSGEGSSQSTDSTR